MAVDCDSSGRKKLRIVGFGIPGCGFYAIDMPEIKTTSTQANALVTILSWKATEAMFGKKNSRIC